MNEQDLPGPRDEFYRAVLDAIPDPVFVLDSDARIIDLNASATRMLGGEGVIGRRAGEALHCLQTQSAACGQAPGCKDCVVRNSVAQALSGAPVHRMRHRLVQRDNAPAVDLLVTSAPIRHGGAELVLVTLEDITELLALRRILPICAHCHKVRDDAEYWQNVEAYCRRQLGIDFSHGVCPECLSHFYSDWNLDAG